VPRPRTYKQAARTQAITVRVTPDQYARLHTEAAQIGVSVSGLAERYITKGVVRIAPEHASAPLNQLLLAELKQVSRALNAIAQSASAMLPEHARLVAISLRDLLQLLIKDEILSHRINALRNRPAPK
jgi:hypothetical protein